MPTDFHHNIFYFYKGGQEDDNARTRQLEDNTTKALINVLENIDLQITVKFLRYIGVSVEEINNVQCCLQKNDIGTSALQRKKELILLAIVPERKNELLITKIDKHHSRPDAWIYGDKYAILVESKVVGYLDYSQMREHYKKLGINSKRKPEYYEITWGEVQRFFKNELNSLSNNANSSKTFLLNQFTEYLDMCNLTDFNGFDSDFFDYFFSHDNEESRIWVKRKINSFASMIFNEMSKVDKSFYQNFDQGQLKTKDNSSWIAFGPKNKKYRKHAHLTIRFDSQGIEIFINIETKPATENFKKNIKNRPEKLKKAIKELCSISNLTFVVEKREKVVASKYNYLKLLEIESYALIEEKLSDSTYDFFISSINTTDLPSINIIKRIERNDAIEFSSGNTPEQLVNELIKTTTKFHKFIVFSNNPISQSQKTTNIISSRVEQRSIEDHFVKWRKNNNPINNWGLTWFLANEFAKRFYSSHGIAPQVTSHEGLGYYGITFDPVHCMVNRECTETLGRLTMFGNVENWQTGSPGDHGLNTIEMCERGVPIEEIFKQSISHLRLPAIPERTHLNCRHKRWGNSFLLLFEIATYLAIEYDHETIKIWNHPDHTQNYIEKLDPKTDMQEHLGAFVFQHKEHQIIFASDGRELSGKHKDNYWKRYMEGESTFSLYEDLATKLKLQ
jgi:hypothetical protein